MKDFVTQYWLTIVVAVYLVGMVLYGHYRGFIRQAVSVVALVASIVIVNLASPYVKTFLLENEGIQTMVKDGITSALAGEDGFALDPEEERQPAVQRAYIEELPLPDQIKDLLIENNNSEVYSQCGQLHPGVSDRLRSASHIYGMAGSGGPPSGDIRHQSDCRSSAGPCAGPSADLDCRSGADDFFHDFVGPGCFRSDRDQSSSHLPLQ